MKKIIICVLMLFTLGEIVAQNQRGFEINGNIEGLKDGEKVILTLYSDSNFYKKFNILVSVDTAIVRSEIFHLSSVVPGGGPRLYTISFEGVEAHKNKFITMLLDNGQHVSVKSIDMTKIHHGILDQHVIVEGSPSNKSWLAFVGVQNMYNQNYFRLNNCMSKVKDSVGFDKSLIEGLLMAKESNKATLYYSFLSDMMDEYKPAVLMTITNNGLFDRTDKDSFWVDIYNGMEDSFKQSHYGKKFKNYLPLCVGQRLPEFTLPSQDGNNLSMKDVLVKGKATIIHFWASKSAHKKQYNDELKQLFKKYHSQGLNIIGLSSDSYMEEWKETLQLEQLPWYNVLDIKGKIVDNVYHELGNEESNPNVLVDVHGKIIAWSKNAVELQVYLDRLLNLEKVSKN